MSKNDLISVIVPVYNTEKYLKRCMDSIVNQTYKKLEIIVVNDGSTDSSADIINDYCKNDKRIVFLNKENGGLSSARNFGLKHATGKYVAFIDSDDFIENDMYESLINEIGDCDICIAGYYLFYEDQTIPKGISGNNKVFFTKNDAMIKLCLNDYLESHVWDKLYKKELFDEIDFPEGKNYEDIYVSHRIFDKCEKICHINSPKYFYVQRDDSIINTPSKKNVLCLVDSFYERHNFFVENQYDDCIEINLGMLTRWYVYGSAFYKKDLIKYYKFLKDISKKYDILKYCPKSFVIGWKFAKIPGATTILYKLLLLYRKLKRNQPRKF